METIKAEVKKRLIEKLRNEQWKIRNAIASNKRKINTLSEESKKLKLELVEIEDLIRVTNT